MEQDKSFIALCVECNKIGNRADSDYYWELWNVQRNYEYGCDKNAERLSRVHGILPHDEEEAKRRGQEERDRSKHFYGKFPEEQPWALKLQEVDGIKGIEEHGADQMTYTFKIALEDELIYKDRSRLFQRNGPYSPIRSASIKKVVKKEVERFRQTAPQMWNAQAEEVWKAWWLKEHGTPYRPYEGMGR